jgi:hypothetical protein
MSPAFTITCAVTTSATCSGLRLPSDISTSSVGPESSGTGSDAGCQVPALSSHDSSPCSFAAHQCPSRYVHADDSRRQ